MIIILKTASLILLFILSFTFIYTMMREGMMYRMQMSLLRRGRVHSGPKQRETRIYVDLVRRELQVMLDVARLRISVLQFIGFTIVMLLSGLIVGAWLFVTIKGMFLCALMFGAAPYIIGKFKQISNQTRARIDFLPAVEIFYQYYVLSESGNIRSILRESLKEQRMSYPIRSVFERLELMLAMHSFEEALERFCLELNHVWANYFASILKTALQDGSNISASLKELIDDMRIAQRSAQVDRNRLLEIRIANFTPLCFLAVFIGINFKLEPAQSYYYYFVEPGGRALLLDALALIFLSMLMGIYLSMKRM